MATNIRVSPSYCCTEPASVIWPGGEMAGRKVEEQGCSGMKGEEREGKRERKTEIGVGRGMQGAGEG